MNTKARYEAANANYWVGCGGTINKGRSVQAGAVGAALSPAPGAARPVPPPLHEPRAPRGESEGAWPAAPGPASSEADFKPGQYNSMQDAFIEHLLGTGYCFPHMTTLVMAASRVWW